MTKKNIGFDQTIKRYVNAFKKQHAVHHDTAAFQEFIKKLYQNMSLSEFEGLNPFLVILRAQSLFDFMQKRNKGTFELRAVHSVDLCRDMADQKKLDLDEDFTLLEIVNDDMPFIVDSITAALHLRQYTIKEFLHPVIHIQRDIHGGLMAAQQLENFDSGSMESIIQIKIPFIKSKTETKKLLSAISDVLDQVRLATSDWKGMLKKNDRAIDSLRLLQHTKTYEETPILQESIDFLSWLEKDHFTFLGFREYDLVDMEKGGAEKTGHLKMDVVKESSLGILSDESAVIFQGFRQMKKLPPDVKHFVEQPELVLISKANKKSDVHRHVHIDIIFVKKFDPETQNVCGLYVFAGLFTSTAYHTSPIRIPLIQRKIQTTLHYAGYKPTSHDGKALLNILETYPRTELFQIQDVELAQISLGILQLQERQRAAIFVRHDPFERFISCLVYVPREKYHTNLRQQIQALLEDHMQGEVTAFYPQLPEDSSLARVHFILKTHRGKIIDYDLKTIESLVQEAAKDWGDHLQEAIIKQHGYKPGKQLFHRYEHMFPLSYRDHNDAEATITDIDYIQKLLPLQKENGVKKENGTKDAGPSFLVNLYEKYSKHYSNAVEYKRYLHLKIYNKDHAIPLSDILPVIENMGFSVYNEIPYRLQYDEDHALWIHDFGLQPNVDCVQDFNVFKPIFEKSFEKIWYQKSENDSFNRLMPTVGLDWRQVIIFRAYYQYMVQIKSAFGKNFASACLAKHAHITQLLFDLFISKFDPSLSATQHKDRRKTIKKIKKKIDAALHDVERLNEDRVLRKFMNLIDATTRTNFFQTDDHGHIKDYVSFKLDSAAIDGVPLPVPFREIFVYSPRMEALHLRGGKVARGGLRWSDRPEDYRTEILGLMKAQMVKNAVIVPVGSKGGFITKKLPKGQSRQDIQAEVIHCYKTMISGLLDVTDNRVGSDIITPDNTIIYDDLDPYLVVAADKGTATFSDIANSLSEDYDFWLGDAFASGGSVGYDHKKMGITARGAWESVKRHFREMNIDTQRDHFRVIGVGDMSGDVFGNGMLLSTHICLQAAFNHLHIFIDPDPCPKKSFTERQRLFELPRSQWSDYDTKLLSKGGMIYDRSSKICVLTPEIQSFLGTKQKEMSPNDLIRQILRSKTDLLWFGGIGTYIKSSQESDIDVGDRANDNVRMTADQIHAKVIGEGANLGITQQGRIELAQKNVRLNTDSIDNSGGVNSSDFEVNIKILLNDVVKQKKLSRAKRDTILASMTDDVADLTLRQNYLQNQAISYVYAHNLDYIDRLERFIDRLEKDGILNRSLEFLPNTKVIQERRAEKNGFVRPELSIILSYAKMNIYNHLLASDLPDNDFFHTRLLSYFPKLLQDQFAKDIPHHRLKREIIATCVTNQAVDRLGPAYMMEISNRTGHSLVNVVRAFELTRAIFDLDDFWNKIESMDGVVDTQTQYDMLHEVGRLTERVIMWILKNEKNLDDMHVIIKKYKDGVHHVIDHLDDFLSKKRKDRFTRHTKALVKANVPDDFAKKIAYLDAMGAVCEIVQISHNSNHLVPVVASLYYICGESFDFRWLRLAARDIHIHSNWEKRSIISIVEEITSQHFLLVKKILHDAAGFGIDLSLNSDPKIIIKAWEQHYPSHLEQYRTLIDEIKKSPAVEIPMLVVASRQLRSLLGDVG
jgi:glutamate dehydrogenase